jgi:hypothetical protein
MTLLVLGCFFLIEGHGLIRSTWGEGASWAATILSGAALGLWLRLASRQSQDT